MLINPGSATGAYGTMNADAGPSFVLMDINGGKVRCHLTGDEESPLSLSCMRPWEIGEGLTKQEFTLDSSVACPLCLQTVNLGIQVALYAHLCQAQAIWMCFHGIDLSVLACMPCQSNA